MLNNLDKKLTFIDFEFAGVCGVGMDLGVFMLAAFNPE
jgi:thiamine kinase-like enzyme